MKEERKATIREGREHKQKRPMKRRDDEAMEERKECPRTAAATPIMSTACEERDTKQTEKEEKKREQRGEIS